MIEAFLIIMLLLFTELSFTANTSDIPSLEEIVNLSPQLRALAEDLPCMKVAWPRSHARLLIPRDRLSEGTRTKIHSPQPEAFFRVDFKLSSE